MQHLTSLSIFFPIYNDATLLPDLIARAEKAARRVTRDFEIIIVNDGSTDDTNIVTRDIMKRTASVRLVTHTKNKGYGAALISGFRAARKDWIFYTDGDGQYDPAELTKLVKELFKNERRVTNFLRDASELRFQKKFRHPERPIDVVNGYKIKRSDAWYRTFLGNLYNWMVHVFYPLPIRDIDCDFRLIRRSLLNTITLKSQSTVICLELITKLQSQGAIFTEIPVHHKSRQYGQSRFFRVRSILSMCRDLVTLSG